MTTRLKFIIESDDYMDISVDYDVSSETVSIEQDDDRISIPLAAVEEVRSALYEQKAALEEEQYEERNRVSLTGPLLHPYSIVHSYPIPGPVEAGGDAA